jgi:hypothetical protein
MNQDVTEADDPLEVRDPGRGLVIALVEPMHRLADDLEASLHGETQKLVPQIIIERPAGSRFENRSSCLPDVF